MADVIHRRKTVPELKAFLSERGINTSIYTKGALIRLAEAATEISLEPEEDEDYHSDRQNRRTIGTVNGDVVLPDINDIKDWESDLTQLPNVEIGDVFVYLMTNCMWSNERLKSYKNDNSFQLFMERHVDNVLVKKTTNDHLYVKCLCTPETRQREKPYVTWVLMDNQACIKSGGCTCVADDGSCKHCIALLFALNDFTHRHKDRGTEVCTDTPCKWDKPRQSSNPQTIGNLDFGSKTMRDNFNPLTKEVNKDQMIKSLFNVCKSHGSCFTHTVEPPSYESDIDIDENNNFPQMSDIISKLKADKNTLPVNRSEFCEHIRDIFTEDLKT